MALKKIFTAQNAHEAHMIKEELASVGIISTIFGLDLISKSRLPDYLPTIFVEDHQFEEALKILQVLKKNQEIVHPAWICTNCREENEGQFSACWKCGTNLESKE